MLSCPKVFTIGRALGVHVRKSDLELFKLAAARLPHTQLVRLVVIEKDGEHELQVG